MHEMYGACCEDKKTHSDVMLWRIPLLCSFSLCALEVFFFFFFFLGKNTVNLLLKVTEVVGVVFFVI
jgi:hypothetical protein